MICANCHREFKDIDDGDFCSKECFDKFNKK